MKKTETVLDKFVKSLSENENATDTPSALKRKLKRDMIEASKMLSVDEARYLVDLYYNVQDYRIVCSNQVRALEMDREPSGLISYFASNFDSLEVQIKQLMGEFTKQYAIGNWLQSICGIGPILSAAFLVTFSPLHRRTAGAWHAYAGVAPGIEWKKGQKRPFNARAKVFVYKAGDCFIKVQNKEKDFYGKLFARQKEYYLERNEKGEFAEAARLKLEKFNIGKTTDAYKAYSAGKLPPAHINAMARRYAAKMFLSHLHDLMWEDYYGEKAPCPYVFSDKFKGGVHKHFIEPPNREFLIGKSLKDLLGTEEEDLRRKEDRANRRKKKEA